MLLLTTKPICPTCPMQHKLVRHTSLSCNFLNDQQDLDTLKLKNACDSSISKKWLCKKKRMFPDHSKENPSVFQTFRQTLSLFPFHQLLPSLSYVGLKERAHIPFVAESYQIKDEKGVKGQFKPLCIASPTISFSFNVRFHKQLDNK